MDFKTEHLLIGGVPAVLYGSQAAQGYLFLHGQMGCKEEAEAFAQVVCHKGRQVLSIDLPGHGARRGQGGELLPWTAVPEIQTALDWAARRWDSVSLRANSIGAYLAMLAWEDPARALLVSPVLDMEGLILTMMGWAGVTEEKLRAQGEIPTSFGQTLSWDYLVWVREHPAHTWRCPTRILYGSGDSMTPRRTAEAYARRHNAELTVTEGGEHWFHTPEQLAALRKWEERAMNTEECLICGAPLEYLTRDEDMECAICHRWEPSKTRCAQGHYVCSDCHTQGMDSIFGLCLAETSADPVAIVRRMVELPFCHTHGPEHHVMVGAALLTAYRNAGGRLELERALQEMYRRGKEVPGGACGFWGACGAGISAGQFLAIATESTPLAQEPWGLSNQMTARALDSIGRVGGPRCCKRDSWLAILAAVDFVRERLGVEMARTVPVCPYSRHNSQCIGSRCPFSAVNRKKPTVAFLCVHNSCRSQMAEALGRRLAGEVFRSVSAGTQPSGRINPDAVRLMKQVYGIDMEEDQYSKPLSQLPAVDLVVTMGCQVQCPALPCSHREDWGLEDPSGQEDRAFLSVMAQIEEKVLDLKRRIQADRQML